MQDKYNVMPAPQCEEIAGHIQNIMIPMRDGLRLLTAVYFPENMPEKAPVVLIRTPYTRRNYIELPDPHCMKTGMVFIMQATRGTGWSDGVFDPAAPGMEYRDAEDFFQWLENQPWFNGRCAMVGASYSGWVQWAAAMSARKSLVAITPRVAPLYSCCGTAVAGCGALQSFSTQWVLTMHHRRRYGYESVPDMTGMKLDWHLPVIEHDIAASYGVNVPYRKFLDVGRHPATTLCAYQESFFSIRCPAFVQGGWFDVFKQETLESYQLMKKRAATAEARAYTRLFIGPWAHGGLVNPELFGAENTTAPMLDILQRFNDGLLSNPSEDPIPDQPTVTYYMLGENAWHTANSWPPPESVSRTAFLHSRGCANSSLGDGRIDWEAPGANETADTYISMPSSPVLSNNGRHESLGCYDFAPQEARTDVLSYTSDTMVEPLTIAGSVRLHFFASASTRDTDFVAILTDVQPDGRAMILTRGIIRARFRKGPETEELIVPGAVNEYTIDLSGIAVSILKGHRLRLDICGQYFPDYHRNANSGKELFTDTELLPSRHTIFHDADHPARLVMDVLG